MKTKETESFSPLEGETRLAFGMRMLIDSAISTCLMVHNLCDLSCMGDEHTRNRIQAAMRDAIDEFRFLLKDERKNEF